MSEAVAPEATFVVFSLDSVPVGIAAAEVESVTLDPHGPLVPATTRHEPQAGPRLLVLRSCDGVRPQPIRIQGTLEVISLPRSHVVALPSLCVTPDSSSMEAAVSDDLVLFLIIDPRRLPGPPGAFAQEARAGGVPAAQESP